jgi:hypothetical protein
LRHLALIVEVMPWLSTHWRGLLLVCWLAFLLVVVAANFLNVVGAVSLFLLCVTVVAWAALRFASRPLSRR